MGPLLNCQMGGAHFVEKQLLNILRQYIVDPGPDTPNSATRHAAPRDTLASYTATATANQQNFTIVPPVTGAPVVCVYNVTVNGTQQLYGWDYLIQWGDKSGPQASKTFQIQFNAGLTAGDAVVAAYRYAVPFKTTEGKLQGLGSFIASGWSRGAMPFPKAQLTMTNDDIETVGLGDNYDTVNQLGAMWHEYTWKLTIMSQYADEVKTLSDDVVKTIARSQHDNNYFMPILFPTNVVSMDYDIEQKGYIRVVTFRSKNREIFGAPV